MSSSEDGEARRKAGLLRFPAGPHEGLPLAPIRLAAALLPLLLVAGCFAGTLDKGQVPRARVCFGEPPIALAIEVAPTFLDQTGEAPPVLGWLLAEGTARLLRASGVFAVVGHPGQPLTGAAARGLPVFRLEGAVTDFVYQQDFRILLAYVPVFLVPVPGAGVLLTTLVLALGGAIYFDEGQLEVELCLRDAATGRVAGRYRGASEDAFLHSLYTVADAPESFWTRPELLLAAALRRAAAEIVRDRRTYRRLAAP